MPPPGSVSEIGNRQEHAHICGVFAYVFNGCSNGAVAAQLFHPASSAGPGFHAAAHGHSLVLGIVGMLGGFRRIGVRAGAAWASAFANGVLDVLVKTN